jgi:hypothetical protein
LKEIVVEISMKSKLTFFKGKNGGQALVIFGKPSMSGFS